MCGWVYMGGAPRTPPGKSVPGDRRTGCTKRSGWGTRNQPDPERGPSAGRTPRIHHPSDFYPEAIQGYVQSSLVQSSLVQVQSSQVQVRSSPVQVQSRSNPVQSRSSPGPIRSSPGPVRSRSSPVQSRSRQVQVQSRSSPGPVQYSTGPVAAEASKVCNCRRF